jgi:general secretion pathway protein J
MIGRRYRRHTGVSGFTLVEALIATLLMGMILAALATVTSQWLPNWNRGFTRVQRAEHLDIAVRRMMADLSAAEFVSPNRKTTRPLFEGTELSVTFVRTAIGPNARTGLEVVRIAETADRQGPLVVRERAPFAPTSSNPYFTDPVALLRMPYRLSFAYAGEDRVWRNTWHGAAQLPSAVRLSIRDAATDRPLAVSTVAMIHSELPAECAAAKAGKDCGSPRPGAEARPGPPDGDAKASPMTSRSQ